MAHHVGAEPAFYGIKRVRNSIPPWTGCQSIAVLPSALTWVVQWNPALQPKRKNHRVILLF